MTVKLPIIVTGCQRSGTTIASHILADLNNCILWDEYKWAPDEDNLDLLKSFIQTDRVNVVIQSPISLHNFHYIFHKLPTLHWVGMKRKTSDIIQSMKRINWTPEISNQSDYYIDHVRFMNNQWGLLKQMLPPENWTELKYNDLKQYPQFIPKNKRLNFKPKQWKLEN